MKRFLIPIIIFAAISWGIFFILLNFLSPFTINNQQSTINNSHVTFFLLTLFSALTFSFALILYFSRRLFGNPPEDGRQTMRKSLHQSFFVSAGVIIFAILQLTGTLNLLTFILVIAVVIALEFTFHT